MPRALARTDSRPSTHNCAEAPPPRESHAARRARTFAHATQIPYPLPKRVARRRALFQLVSPGEVGARHRTAFSPRPGRGQSVAVEDALSVARR